MKKIASFIIFLAFVIAPLSVAYAQVSIEQRVVEAAESLPPDARMEFLELIRSPEEVGVTFEDLGISQKVADRLHREMSIASIAIVSEDIYDQEKIEKKLNKLANKVAEINDKLMSKAEEISEKEAQKLAELDAKLLANADKALVEVNKAVGKAEEDAAKSDVKGEEEAGKEDDKAGEKAGKSK